MVYERGLIVHLQRWLESYAKEQNVNLSTSPRTIVKSFIAKLMTHTVRRILINGFALERPGLAWIPGLKTFLPVFWQVLENMYVSEEGRKKLEEWLWKYATEGKIPNVAIDEILSKMKELLEAGPEKLKEELPPERYMKFIDGFKVLIKVVEAIGGHLSDDWTFLDKYLSEAEKVAAATPA